MLIKHKANVIATLHNAISHGRQEIVKILLKNNANTEVIRKILPFAAETGPIEVIKILLDNKQDTEVIKQALDRAVDHKRMEVVKYFLAEKARTDKYFDFNEQCFYPIYFAAKKKYENAVKLLLEEKINLRLNYTAGKEDIEIINFLLKIGANHFNCIIDKHGRTPLHWAAFENDEKLIEDLTRKQPSLIYVKDENGETALHEAVWNGHTKIVKILLNQGAKINCKNKNGWKPLHIAVISFHIELFKLLRNEDKDDFQLNNSLISSMILEQFEQKDNNDIDILSLYQFLLKFIDKSAENFRNQNDKNALIYLYTYTLSKICNLKFEPRSNLIIDIDKYFDTIKEDIKSLKYEATRHEAHRFKEEIKIKVEEAYKTASEQIKVEVDKIVIEINEKINSLLDEIKKLMKKVEDNKLALEKEHSNLKNKLVLKQILEILKSVGLILNCVGCVGGPIGIVCNVIINGGGHAVEALISKDNNELKFEIPPEIKVSLEKMEKMCSKRNQRCIRTDTEKIRIKKNENVTTSQKTKAELEIIQTFNTAIKKIEIAVELYDKYKKDKEELDSLNDSIKQADDDIKKLMQYEDNNNSIIVTMIKRMQNDIYNIESKIDKKSHFFLDLTEWQVQTSLKYIKWKIVIKG
ncbi:Ankyrin repeat domain-containing 52 protein, partial [Gigaspora margarita]